MQHTYQRNPQGGIVALAANKALQSFRYGLECHGHIRYDQVLLLTISILYFTMQWALTLNMSSRAVIVREKVICLDSLSAGATVRQLRILMIKKHHYLRKRPNRTTGGRKV